MRFDSTAELLAATAAFGGLDELVIRELTHVSLCRDYPAGQIIFHEGDPGDSLYVVATGLVKLVRTSPQGDRLLLGLRRPPDIFGEVALLDGAPRAAMAETMKPTTLVAIGRERFKEMISSTPGLAEHMLISMGFLLRDAIERGFDLIFMDLGGRVAKLLVDLGEVLGEERGDGTTGILLTQADLASYVGGSRPAVNQVLGNLAARGFIDLGTREVVIKRPDRLRQRAGLAPAR